MRHAVTLLFALLALAPAADARLLDRDRDRLPDRWERRHGLSASRANASRDPDRDGASNREEHRARTNPRRRDTDRDRLLDGFELAQSRTNPRKRDTDGDGWYDGRELRLGSGPLDARSRPRKPETRISSAPLALSASAASSFSFGASVPFARFQCRIDGGAWRSCTPSSVFHPGEGSHGLAVRALNLEGWQDPTPATFTWTVDTRAPAVRLVAAPPPFLRSTTATFAFESEPGAALECRRDGDAWRRCSSPASESSLAQGSHGFAVRARDAAGNVSAPEARGFVVDTVPPDTTVTSRPDTGASTSTFSFTATEEGTFECRLDWSPWAPCSSPVTYSGLATGYHYFHVRAVDRAGNRDPWPPRVRWRVTG